MNYGLFVTLLVVSCALAAMAAAPLQSLPTAPLTVKKLACSVDWSATPPVGTVRYKATSTAPFADAISLTGGVYQVVLSVEETQHGWAYLAIRLVSVNKSGSVAKFQFNDPLSSRVYDVMLKVKNSTITVKMRDKDSPLPGQNFGLTNTPAAWTPRDFNLRLLLSDENGAMLQAGALVHTKYKTTTGGATALVMTK